MSLLKSLLLKIESVIDFNRKSVALSRYVITGIGAGKIATSVDFPANPQRLGFYIFNSTSNADVLITIPSLGVDASMYFLMTFNPVIFDLKTYGEIVTSEMTIDARSTIDITVIERSTL